MSVFNHYARYYDLLYKDKDYAGEAAFVHQRLRDAGCGGSTLLELGCGTGKHALEFAKLGWSVKGYDFSEAMVRQAGERAAASGPDLARRMQFASGDVRTLRAGATFDAVISLFHVMSYQTSNHDLRNAFKTAASHLQKGGLFFFDFWYGPAVLSDPPVVRVKRLEDERIQVTRLAEPVPEPNQNRVTVNYHVFVKDKVTGAYSETQESHPMRYLFLPEMEQALADLGLSIISSSAWMSQRSLGNDTWYGCVLAQKA